MYIKKHSQVTDGYKKMLLGFVIISVLLVALILYFSASKAIIKITPKVTKAETDFVFDVVTDGASINESIQGILNESDVDGSLEAEATGTKVVGTATLGKVTLINKKPDVQTLVKTTRLLSEEGILLRLSERVNVPGNSQLEASVYADNSAAFTELAPTTFTIPGLRTDMQDKVYAESKSVLRNSGDSVKVIKAIDIARAKETLTENLYNKAIEQFTSQLPSKDFTTLVVSKKVIDDKTSDAVDAQKDKFTVSLKLKVTVLGIDQKKILELAGQKLGAAVANGQQLLGLNTDKFSYLVQSYNETSKVATIKVHAEGNAVIKEDSPILDKNKLSGLSAKGVELYLANYEEIESVQVELSPFWVREVPRLSDHIIISIVNPTQGK